MKIIPRTNINKSNKQLEVTLFKKFSFFSMFGVSLLSLIIPGIKIIYYERYNDGIILFPIVIGYFVLLVYLSKRRKQVIIMNDKEISISSTGLLFTFTKKYQIDYIEEFEVETQNINSNNLIYFNYLDDEIQFGIDIPLDSLKTIADIFNVELIRLKNNPTDVN
jgi:hypothetical protein